MNRRYPLFAVLLVGALSWSCKSKDSENDKAESKESAKTTEASKEKPEAPPRATQQHSNANALFKEPAVYVDGKPVAVLTFGELPVPLEVAWHEEDAPVEIRPGEEPKPRKIKQRRYRFRDYLAGLGVDVSKVVELHIYGSTLRKAAVVVSGDTLRNNDEFKFRFGGAIWGKPLPSCPGKMGDAPCPDQLGALTVYIDKKPPVRKGAHFYLDDKIVEGIPYFGDSIRGGVRIYLDGPLVATIKRKLLVASGIKSSGDEKNPEYSLPEFLSSQGVNVDEVQEAWLIFLERRVKKLNREEFMKARFRAAPGGSGTMLVGPQNTETQVIYLHRKPVPKEDLPVLLDEELDKVDG